MLKEKNEKKQSKRPAEPIIDNTTHSGACANTSSFTRTNLPPSPVILWIELGGKPKWLQLKFGYHDVMRVSPITLTFWHAQKEI